MINSIEGFPRLSLNFAQVKNGDAILSNNARDAEENNFLGDYYLEEEVDDTYENSATIKCNYHSPFRVSNI